MHGGVGRLMIQVLDVGQGATVQDLGRVGHAAWGLGSGGAADRGSLQLANRLVGNTEDAAAFEVTLGGFTARFTAAVWIAITGAPAPTVLDGTRRVRIDGPQWMPAGSTLALGPPPEQVRSYIAVRGGLDTEPILGSRAVDESSGIGRALRPGDTITTGSHTCGLPLVDQAPRRRWPSGPLVLHGTAGPRDDWFTAQAMHRLATQPYVVQPASNRVGVRLAGPALARTESAVDRELLSEPTLRGAVEVPADGQPIVFAADHPTTCGYPVVAVLDPASADLLSQCRPGQAVTFALRAPQLRLNYRHDNAGHNTAGPAGGHDLGGHAA